MNNQITLKINQVTKSFTGLDQPVLNNINLTVKAAQKIAITGVSGSGKSTLLHLMAGLEKPDNGQITILNKDLTTMKSNDLCALRNNSLGFIYQFHHLMPDFTALENMMMPLTIRGNLTKKHNTQLSLIVKKLGLEKRINHYPHELSGGERQRISIGRAIITSPDIILADEPTGNLDNKNANKVFDLFLELAEELETSIILVTHDLSLAKKMNKIYNLTQGKITAT
ncbi:ATP-binding cassette domain-containing protein [Methylophilaceae bacterium]|jgi:lipoprotein-releasing system ATP-binding protein|nr:ATP-binding cassette domain-containing protein [Methylophilaceae bacterium]